MNAPREPGPTLPGPVRGRRLRLAAPSALLLLLPSLATAQLEIEETRISGGAARADEQVLPGTLGPSAPSGPLAPAPLAPATVGTSFDGPDFDDNAVQNASGLLKIPPDAIGAAGTDRVIAVVNTMIEARTKSGTLLFIDSLADFFAPLTPATDTFDPKVLYDHYEDRFLVVTLERVEPGLANPDPGNTARILLAVSKTATPATASSADWYYHAMSGKFTFGGPALDYWADYPGFELDEEAVYLTASLFSFEPDPDPTGRVYGGVRLWILDKGVVGGFYAGGTAAVSVHDFHAATGTSAFAATTLPALVYGATGVGSGIGTFLVAYSGLTAGGPGGSEFVNVYRINDPLGSVSFTQEFVNVGDLEDVGGAFGFPALTDAPQAGAPSDPIEVNDRRALDAVWRSGSLWLTTTLEPNSGADAGETTAHWIRLDTSAVTSSVSAAGLIGLADQGDIGGEDIAPATYTFFPSLAVNAAGDAKFGFSASAATLFPGAFVTGREWGDPAGTVQASETVRSGLDFYIRRFSGTRNRWGDYSGTALDPSDDDLFWVFNEYAILRGTPLSGEDGRWGTAWASCRFGTTTTTTTLPVTECNDGLDNDLDGDTDANDPACAGGASFEGTQCDDDLDNDGDLKIDWDGGSGGATADPNCGGIASRNREKQRCGLGFELALLLPPLLRLRRRR